LKPQLAMVVFVLFQGSVLEILACFQSIVAVATARNLIKKKKRRSVAWSFRPVCSIAVVPFILIFELVRKELLLFGIGTEHDARRKISFESQNDPFRRKNRSYDYIHTLSRVEEKCSAKLLTLPNMKV